MRLAGIPPQIRVRGVAGRALGALPANTVSPSGRIPFTPPDPTPYPSLPRAGIGQQTPWGSAAGALVPFQNRELPEGYTPGYVATGGGVQRSGPGRVQLEGLSGYEVTPFPFPFDNPAPAITQNVVWWTGYPVQNKGTPHFSNDAEEYLRSALVDSRWDDVEKWMGWAINNGLSLDQLRTFPFGRYKWINGPNNTRKQLPFSDEDYRTFFDRFLKYTATAPVTAQCINDRVRYMREQGNVHPSNRYQLSIGDCVVHGSIAEGLMEVAAFYAAAVGVAMLATAAAGALAAGGSTAAGGGAAAGAGAGAGAGTVSAGASTAALAVPAGVEVVTVVAPAISVGGSVATAAAAGAIVAAAPPPVIAPAPPATAPPEIPVIETVVTQASAVAPMAPVTAGTIGAGLATGAVAVIPQAPPISPAPPQTPSSVIEEVTVQASQPTSPVTAGTVGAGLTTGAIAAVPQAPPITPPAQVIETVTVEATAPPSPTTAGTIGAGITTGAIAVIPQAPPITPQELPSEVIEEVTVEASPEPPPVITIDPLEAIVTGVSTIPIVQPIINVPEPTLPEIDTEPSLTDTVTNGIRDAVSSIGADAVIRELERILEDLLGRPPTQGEIDQWEDWINDGGVTPPPSVTGPAQWTFWLLGAAIAYAVYEMSRKPKKRRKARR